MDATAAQSKEPAVLYCDPWLLALDKPAGTIVHGDGTGERTLTDAASDLMLSFGDGFSASDVQAINRLDRDTTGIVLFSLDKKTQPSFDRLVAEHGIEKRYRALAEGRIEWNEKLIDKPIGRDRHHADRMRISGSGKPSRTEVKVLKRMKARKGLPYRLDTAHRQKAPDPRAYGERGPPACRRPSLRDGSSLRSSAPRLPGSLRASRHRRTCRNHRIAHPAQTFKYHTVTTHRLLSNSSRLRPGFLFQTGKAGLRREESSIWSGDKLTVTANPQYN